MKKVINTKVNTEKFKYILIQEYPSFNLYQKVKIIKITNSETNETKEYYKPLYKECFYD